MKKLIVAALIMGMSMLTACSVYYNDAGSNSNIKITVDTGENAGAGAGEGANSGDDLNTSAGADAADDLKVSADADVAAGETQGDESSSRVYLDESEVEDLKEKFYETNVTNVFKNHDSVEFQIFIDGHENELCWENSEGKYAVQRNLGRAVYCKNDRINYDMIFDEETGMYDFGIDFYIYPEYETFYYVVYSDKSLALNEEHEKFHAYREGEFIYLIVEPDDEVSRKIFEQNKTSGGTVDYHGQKVFVEYILDADNYDCIERTVKYIDDGKEEVLETTKIFYDTPEPIESLSLRAVFERDSKNTMDITIVVDPGTKDEKTYSATIPQNLEVFITPGEPYVMFDDPDCTMVTSWDRMSDLTRYVVVNPDEELTERYNELLEKLMNGEG